MVHLLSVRTKHKSCTFIERAYKTQKRHIYLVCLRNTKVVHLFSEHKSATSTLRVHETQSCTFPYNAYGTRN